MGSGILSCGIGISSAVRWSETVFRQKNALRRRTCSRLKTPLYFWRNNLFRYLSVRNTTFLKRRWLSAGSCLAIDSFCPDSFFVTTHYIQWNIELVSVFWLPNKDLIRKNSYNGHYLLPMISFCTPNNGFIHAPFDNERRGFSMDKPLLSQHLLLHLVHTVTCIFLLTMLKRQYMVSCKPLAAPDSKPLMNANIRGVKCREKTALLC